MRVLALAHRYLPNHNAGAETHLHALLAALAARGHQVAAHLSRQDGDEYEVDGVHVHPGPLKTAVTAQVVAAADVLVAHLECTPAATRLGAWNDRPVVLVHHNNLQVTKEAVTDPGGRVDLVAVNSRWMQADLLDHLGPPPGRPRAVVVRPLVDLAAYEVEPGDRVTLVNLRPQERSPGGAVMGKGGELFWELADRMPDTDFLGVRGAYGRQLVRWAPNVRVLDHLPHAAMRDLVYARTRVLLMPSSYESWGRVGVEAMCSGIPVLAHPTSGLLESLGDAGIFVDRGDVDGWVAALRALEDPAVYEAASARARARAAELDPAEDLDRWCDAVETVASQNLIWAR